MIRTAVISLDRRPRTEELKKALRAYRELARDATDKVLHGLVVLKRSSVFVKFAISRYVHAVRVVQLLCKRLVAQHKLFRTRALDEWKRLEAVGSPPANHLTHSKEIPTPESNAISIIRRAPELVRIRVIAEEFIRQRRSFAALWRSWRRTSLHLESQRREAEAELRDALQRQHLAVTNAQNTHHFHISAIRSLQDRVAYLIGRMEHHENARPVFRGMVLNTAELASRVSGVLKTETTERVQHTMGSLGIKAEDPAFLEAAVRRYETILEEQILKQKAENRRQRRALSFSQNASRGLNFMADGTSPRRSCSSSSRSRHSSSFAKPVIPLSIADVTNDEANSMLRGIDHAPTPPTKLPRSSWTGSLGLAAPPRIRMDSKETLFSSVPCHAPSPRVIMNDTETPKVESSSLPSPSRPGKRSVTFTSCLDSCPPTGDGRRPLQAHEYISDKQRLCFEALGIQPLAGSAVPTPSDTMTSAATEDSSMQHENERRFRDTLRGAFKSSGLKTAGSLVNSSSSKSDENNDHERSRSSSPRSLRKLPVGPLHRRSPPKPAAVPGQYRESRASEIRRNLSPTERRRATKQTAWTTLEDNENSVVPASTSPPTRKAPLDTNIQRLRELAKEARERQLPAGPIPLPPPMPVEMLRRPTPPTIRLETTADVDDGGRNEQEDKALKDEKDTASLQLIGETHADDDKHAESVAFSVQVEETQEAALEQNCAHNQTAPAPKCGGRQPSRQPKKLELDDKTPPEKKSADNLPAASVQTSVSASRGSITITAVGEIYYRGMRPKEYLQAHILSSSPQWNGAACEVAASSSSPSASAMGARGHGNRVGSVHLLPHMSEYGALPTQSRVIHAILLVSVAQINHQTVSTSPSYDFVAIGSGDGSLSIYTLGNPEAPQCVFSDPHKGGLRAPLTRLCMCEKVLCAACDDRYVYLYTAQFPAVAAVPSPPSDGSPLKRRGSIRDPSVAPAAAISASDVKWVPAGRVQQPHEITAMISHKREFFSFSESSGSSSLHSGLSSPKDHVVLTTEAGTTMLTRRDCMCSAPPSAPPSPPHRPATHSFLVVATFEASVLIWDVIGIAAAAEVMTPLLKLEGHIQGVHAMMHTNLLPGGCVVTCGYDSYVKLWTLTDAAYAKLMGRRTNDPSESSRSMRHGNPTELRSPTRLRNARMRTPLVNIQAFPTRDFSDLQLSQLEGSVVEDRSRNEPQRDLYTTASFTQHKKAVIACCEVHPGNGYQNRVALCTLSRDDTVRVWDPVTLETTCIITNIPGHLFVDWASFISRRCIVLALADASYLAFCTETGKRIGVLGGSNLSTTPSGVSPSTTVHHHHSGMESDVSHTAAMMAAPAQCVSKLSDRGTLAVGTSAGAVLVLSVGGRSGGIELAAIPRRVHNLAVTCISSLQWSPFVVITGSEDRRVTMTNVPIHEAATTTTSSSIPCAS